MNTCEVLIVGGGPGGSSCAWKLRQAGVDAVVMDAAVFPRDKVCAGWITPQAVSALQLDIAEYRDGRTLQDVTGFRTGVIGGHLTRTTTYNRVVSYAVRRCEFDHYLLERSRARLILGSPVTTIRREGAGWVVNEALRASMLIGAGGHFCPVARWLNQPAATPRDAPLVVAQEAEFLADSTPADAEAAEIPALYFYRDLKGYGWCVRKGQYVNVGVGRLDPRALPAVFARFLDFLRGTSSCPPLGNPRWRGHAYLVRHARQRRVLDGGVLLLGDAAGLAYPQSGEGIRPAIESGLLAASTIIDAKGHYDRDSLEPYAARLTDRFGDGSTEVEWPSLVPARVRSALAPLMLSLPFVARRIVLDRWFLRASELPLDLALRRAG